LRTRHRVDSIRGLRRAPEEAHPEAIGSVIRRLRIERGWSQEALAFEVRSRTKSSPTAGAIGQIERGVTRPRQQTIEGIARALDLSPEDLAEYRLAAVRRLFDERAVGLDQAIANLGAFEQAFSYSLAAPEAELGPVTRRRPVRKPRR
jgi:transcriptional regulator with XRE-family HTH domain